MAKKDKEKDQAKLEQTIETKQTPEISLEPLLEKDTEQAGDNTGKEQSVADVKSTDQTQSRCSFCGRRQDECEQLYAGQNAFICDDCVDLCVYLDDLVHSNTEYDEEDDDDNDSEDYEYSDNDPFTDEDFRSEIVRLVQGNLYAQLDNKKTTKKQEKKANDMAVNQLTPREIHAELDKYVIGQNRAKKTLAVAVYNHYKRLELMSQDNSKFADVELAKSNILLLGPTGCGKTLLAQSLARMLHVPIAICDATALTEAGYVGEDVENILLHLINNANGNIKAAERGIIYVDEIDKISRRGDNPSITRDVSGEGVQQALLKILEGTVANVPPQAGRKHPHQEFLQIDTTNILFILGGAFAGIEKIIGDRLDNKSIGFGANVEGYDAKKRGEALQHVTPQDLLKFGLIPEFVGRVPVVVPLEGLDKDALERIIQEPKNALLKQYQKLLAMDGVELEFTKEAIGAIADKALALKTGARGLRAIVENLMLDVMYEIPSLEDIVKVVIDADNIENNTKPKYLKRAELEPTA